MINGLKELNQAILENKWIVKVQSDEVFMKSDTTNMDSLLGKRKKESDQEKLLDKKRHKREGALDIEDLP